MADSLRTVRFPNETDEYGDARAELLKAEIDLRRRTEEVAALRRRLPLGGAVAEDRLGADALPAVHHEDEAVSCLGLDARLQIVEGDGTDFVVHDRDCT